jgi:hypothetical protein
MQNNWAKYTGGAIHLSYCNGVQASFPSNTFIGEPRHVCSRDSTQQCCRATLQHS